MKVVAQTVNAAMVGAGEAGLEPVISASPELYDEMNVLSNIEPDNRHCFLNEAAKNDANLKSWRA